MGFAPGGFENTRLSGNRAFTKNPFQAENPSILECKQYVEKRARLGFRNKWHQVLFFAEEPTPSCRREAHTDCWRIEMEVAHIAPETPLSS